MLEAPDDRGRGHRPEQPNQQPGQPMPEPLRDRFLGGAARACRPGEIAPQARKVLFVLLEQDPQHPVRRDQPQEPAVGVDHSEAAFVAVHHSPGCAFLVGIRRDLRRVGVHDVLDAGVRVGSQKALDRDQPDEPPRLENDDILGAPELAPYKLPSHLADVLLAPSHGDALGRVLRRDAQ